MEILTSKRSRLLIPLLLLGGMLVAARAPETGRGKNPPLWEMSFPAIAMPSEDLELAFVVSGKIEHMNVQPEQRVSKGEVLAQLDDAVQREQTKLAGIVASDTSAVDTARERTERAKRDLDRYEEAFSKDGVTQRELDDARTTYNLEKINLEAAKLQGQQNKVILSREQARLDQMKIISPIDGVVTELMRDEGESIDELQTVMRVVDIDPLWLDVAIPARFARQLKKGDKAEISWRDLADEPPLEGHVLFVSSVGDAASSSIRIRLEAANPAGIPGEQHAVVRFIRPSDADTDN